MYSDTVQSTGRFMVLVYEKQDSIPICNILKTSNRAEAIEAAERLKLATPKARRMLTVYKILDLQYLVSTIV